MRALLRRQEGVGLVMVLAFMGLTVPLITAALGLATTLSVDSRVKNGILKSQYSVLAGTQYALYRVIYETGYIESLPTGVPDSFSITINGTDVTVTVLNTNEPPGVPPPPSSDNSRRLQATKTVNPVTASPSVLTTFSYAITVENLDDEPENLKKVHDRLPPGFVYLAGTTSGVTTDDPVIVNYPGGQGEPGYQELTWNLAPLQITLQPGQSANLQFDAEASAAEGNYCNEAWAEPGGDKTTSGQTARVQVGSPANNLCGGQAVAVSKSVDPSIAPGDTSATYTYTIAIENVGSAVLNMSLVRDLLPTGFLYLAGSTTGDLTTADPNDTMFQGRQRLDWVFSPKLQLTPGQSSILIFQADAVAAAGDYWNEVWVTLDEFSYSVYTGPTAVVNVMSITETSATDGMHTVSSEVWVGTSSHIVNEWTITR